MRQCLTTAAIIWALTTAGPAHAEKPFADMDLQAALKAAKKDNKAVMIDFYTTWCGPCRMLDRATWPDKDVQKFFADELIGLKVDADRNRMLRYEYKIRSFPSMVFLTPDGAEIGRLVGFHRPNLFLQNARSILAKWDKTAAAPAAGPSDNDPAATDKQLSALERMKHARELAEKGERAAALTELLWCYDHGAASDPVFASVRLSFLIPQIAQLGEEWPQATAELKKRRAEAVRAVLSTDALNAGGADRVLEAAAIDRALREPARSVQLFDELAEHGSRGTALRRALLDEIIDALLAMKRYRDIVDLGGDAFERINRRIDECRRAAQRADDAGNMKRNGLVVYLRQQVFIHGGKFYEALLGAGRLNEAESLARLVTDFDASALSYSTLVNHAVRAGAYDSARELVRQASEKLRPEELKTVQRAAGGILTS
jgi:thiol-disulfide isomerase/thioredoxin